MLTDILIFKLSIHHLNRQSVETLATVSIHYLAKPVSRSASAVTGNFSVFRRPKKTADFKMDDLPIPTAPVNLERVLEALKEQETFLNIDPKDDSLLYWILLSLKCIAAGYGTNHLLNTYTTMTFVIGTLINACINLKSWFVPAFTIIFGAATFKVLNDVDRNTFLPTLCWIGFCIRIECEFYMDIYLVLCFMRFIFKMYGKDHHKAVVFIISMVGFNWMVDNDEIYIKGNVIFMLGNYIFVYFLLRPSNEDWEYGFGRRCCHYYIKLVLFYALLYKYYRIALVKGYIQNYPEFFEMIYNDALSSINEVFDSPGLYEIFENLKKLAIDFFIPEPTIEETIVNISSMPSFSM